MVEILTSVQLRSQRAFAPLSQTIIHQQMEYSIFVLHLQMINVNRLIRQKMSNCTPTEISGYANVSNHSNMFYLERKKNEITLKCLVKSQAFALVSGATTELRGFTGFRLLEISPSSDRPGVTALDRRSSSPSFRRSGFSGLGCDRLRWSAVKKLWT